MSLRDDIKQSRPFGTLEQEALLNIQRTATLLGYAVAERFKPFGLTPTQYNVLRILRGAEAEGLCRNEIGDRLITPVPDVTRLLDRMEEAGLIQRERDAEDRRQVRTTLTRKGLRAVDELDRTVLDMHREHLGHMSRSELRTLVELLESARAKVQ
jgi:DNA-binding MarR family transcriptional regulator